MLLKRLVALKLPRLADDPAFVERFEREACAMASVGHRSLCAIHDIEQFDGMRYTWMAYIDGETLVEWVWLELSNLAGQSWFHRHGVGGDQRTVEMRELERSASHGFDVSSQSIVWPPGLTSAVKVESRLYLAGTISLSRSPVLTSSLGGVRIVTLCLPTGAPT